MKVKLFTYPLTEFGSRETGSAEFICDDLAMQEINEFIKNKDVVDIKVNTYEARFHNNGGYPQVNVLYTIMYM